MKTGPLGDIHRQSAVVMDDVGGWQLPVIYGSLESEYEASIRSSALVDLSHFGRLVVRGKDRVDLLHRLSTNDLQGIGPGQIRPTLLLTDKGRLIDRLEVWASEDSLLLRVSTGAADVVRRWIDKYTIIEEIEVTDTTDVLAEALLVGPQAESAIVPVAGNAPAAGSFRAFQMGNGEVMIGSVRLGESFAVRLIGEGRAVAECWKEILASESGVRPVGMMAYEGWRISRGIPAFGREITEEFNPYDAGLRGDISFTKGCYIGQEIVARLDTYQKIKRRLSGIVLEEPCPVQKERAVARLGEEEAGWVTSCLSMPLRGKHPGLAVLREEHAAPGTPLVVRAGGRSIPGVVSQLPMSL